MSDGSRGSTTLPVNTDVAQSEVFADAGQVVGDKELPAVCDGSLSMHCAPVICWTCGVSGEYQHLAEQMDTAAHLQWNYRPAHDQHLPWRLWLSRCWPE